MFKQSNILMLGAAERNVGKTEFACRLIAQYAASRPVIGVKVTTVRERDGRCPRGGKGCGVCSSLQENYCITDESPDIDGKDTTRMLQAGAHKVYWLRVLDDFLKEGVADLLTRLPDKAVVILESNSARRVLQPGVFLVIKEKGSSAIKPSCEAVVPHADQVLTFDGAGWDLPPERCVFEQGQWSLRDPRESVGTIIPVEGQPTVLTEGEVDHARPL
jgi:hypothetical protein